MRLLALILLAFSAAFGQASPVPYAPNSDGPGPTFNIRYMQDSFPGRHATIHKVDFRNLKPLKNGRYTRKDVGVFYSESLDSVYYLDGPAAIGQAALVLSSWFSAGGSSSQGEVAKVFKIVNGRLQLTQTIDWDTHFQAGQPTAAFEASTNMLVIRSSHYIPGDAHCCVSAMDVVTFQWNGSAFKESDLRTELSEYGKSEGKRLPR